MIYSSAREGGDPISAVEVSFGIGDTVRIKRLNIPAEVVEITDSMGRPVAKVRRANIPPFISTHYLHDLELVRRAPCGSVPG